MSHVYWTLVTTHQNNQNKLCFVEFAQVIKFAITKPTDKMNETKKKPFQLRSNQSK